MKWVAALALTIGILATVPQRAQAIDTGDAILATAMVGLTNAFVCGAFAFGNEFAEEEPDADKKLDRKGAFLRLNVSGGAGPLSLGSNAVTTGWGFAADAGYRCSEGFASEARFEYLNGFSTQGLDIGRKSSPFTLTTNTRYYILRQRIQPFVLAGGGLMIADLPNPGGPGHISHTSIAIRLGAGADFYLTDNIVVSGEFDWVRPFDQLRDLQYIVVEAGIGYRF